MDKNVISQLGRLIGRVISELGDTDTNIRKIADLALGEAEDIARLSMQDILRMKLRQIAGDKLRDGSRGTEPKQMLLLRGFEDVKLPYRIAVPALGVDPDETNVNAVWRVLHRCSIEDGEANLRMRGQLIQGQQAVWDRLRRVVDTAIAAGGGPADGIGKVLGVVELAETDPA